MAAMTTINPDLSILELLKILNDHHAKVITLSDAERQDLIALLKKRGAEELDYGEEVEHGTVRIVKRVTGAVGVYTS